MRTYNLSPTKDRWYSQRNNEIDPGKVCMCESSAEALDLAGWPSMPGQYKQPGDNLTAFLRGPEGLAAQKKLAAWSVGTYYPNEVWIVVEWALNEVFYPVNRPATFRERWDMREILHGLTKGHAFYAGTKLTSYGHVVNVVGFETDQEEDLLSWQQVKLEKVRNVIIDDPYGDGRSGKYVAGSSGWNCRYSMAEWNGLHVTSGDSQKKMGMQIRRKA